MYSACVSSEKSTGRRSSGPVPWTRRNVSIDRFFPREATRVACRVALGAGRVGHSSKAMAPAVLRSALCDQTGPKFNCRVKFRG